jgi:hypothetical protein
MDLLADDLSALLHQAYERRNLTARKVGGS